MGYEGTLELWFLGRQRLHAYQASMDYRDSFYELNGTAAHLALEETIASRNNNLGIAPRDEYERSGLGLPGWPRREEHFRWL